MKHQNIDRNVRNDGRIYIIHNENAALKPLRWGSLMLAPTIHGQAGRSASQEKYNASTATMYHAQMAAAAAAAEAKRCMHVLATCSHTV